MVVREYRRRLQGGSQHTPSALGKHSDLARSWQPSPQDHPSLEHSAPTNPTNLVANTNPLTIRQFGVPGQVKSSVNVPTRLRSALEVSFSEPAKLTRARGSDGAFTRHRNRFFPRTPMFHRTHQRRMPTRTHFPGTVKFAHFAVA